MTTDGGESPSPPNLCRGDWVFEKESQAGGKREPGARQSLGRAQWQQQGGGWPTREHLGSLTGAYQVRPSPIPRVEDRALASGGPTVCPSQTGALRGLEL